MRLTDRLTAIWHAPERYKEMETLIMATSADFAARLDTVTNELSTKLADLKTQIDAAVASGQAADQAWSDALEGPIERLEGMGTSEDTPDPVGDDGGAGTEPTA